MAWQPLHILISNKDDKYFCDSSLSDHKYQENID